VTTRPIDYSNGYCLLCGKTPTARFPLSELTVYIQQSVRKNQQATIPVALADFCEGCLSRRRENFLERLRDRVARELSEPSAARTPAPPRRPLRA